MIISKPKFRAISAVGVFVLICLGLGGYNLHLITKESHWWFNYAMTLLFLPLAGVLLLRLIFNYKLVRIGSGRITIAFPTRGFKQTRLLNEIDTWDETIIQTTTGVYRHLKISFPNLVVTISQQENTNYEKIMDYLKKKAPRKKL